MLNMKSKKSKISIDIISRVCYTTIVPDGITPEQLVAAVNDMSMEALDAEHPPDEALGTGPKRRKASREAAK